MPEGDDHVRRRDEGAGAPIWATGLPSCSCTAQTGDLDTFAHMEGLAAGQHAACACSRGLGSSGDGDRKASSVRRWSSSAWPMNYAGPTVSMAQVGPRAAARRRSRVRSVASSASASAT